MNIGVISPLTLMRKALCSLLGQVKGAEVVFDGHDVVGSLETLQKHRPDLILIDVQDPGADLEALPRLRALLGDTKILLLTDREDEAFEVRAVKAGARGCFSKGSDPESLERALKLVGLAGQVWVSRQAAARIIGRFIEARAPEDRPAAELTQRELEILGLVANGYHNKEIGSRLFISENTVKTHLYTIYKKLGVTSRMAAAMHYFQQAKQKSYRRAVPELDEKAGIDNRLPALTGSERRTL